MDPAERGYVNAIDDLSEHDSGLGDETSRSTVSLESAIFDFEQEHGRLYHAFHQGKYVLPNDEREQERMNVHHRSMRLMLDNKHWVSPSEPARIFDVGTGTGIWAIEVADLRPSTQVVGIDLSPIQPNLVPPNLEFQIMDADDQWVGFDRKFDLIHTQYMNGISVKAWMPFYKQAFTALRPRGWVENHELDFNFLCDGIDLLPTCAYVRWATLWNDGLRKLGMTGRCDREQMKEQMEAEGFVNVTTQSRRMPVGAWSTKWRHNEAGLLFQEGMLGDISGLSLKVFLDGLQWSRAKMELLLMEVRQELKDCKHHLYMPLVVVMGQRPSH